MNPKKRIGEMLVSLGVCTPEQLQHALTEQKAGGGKERLGTVLQRLGYVSPKALYQALSRQFRSA